MTTGGEQDELSRMLLERLYGELDEAGNRALDARLATDPAARRQLERLERTLAVTREALRGPLAEAAPARVRANVLAAARQAVAREQGAAPVRERETLAVMDRLLAWLRRPWFVPALVGATAIGIFAVSRDRIVTPELQEVLRPRPQTAAEPAPPVDEAKGEGRAEPLAEEQKADDRAAENAVRRKAAPRRQRSADKERREVEGASRFVADDALGGIASGGGAPAAESLRAAESGYAQPPSGWAGEREAAKKASAPAPAAPPAQVAKQKREDSPQPTASPAEADVAEEAPSGRSVSATRGASAARGAPANIGRGPDLTTFSRGALVSRADRAYHDGRWFDARLAYVELLRREPDGPTAPRWRERIAACDRVLRTR